MAIAPPRHYHPSAGSVGGADVTANPAGGVIASGVGAGPLADTTNATIFAGLSFGGVVTGGHNVPFGFGSAPPGNRIPVMPFGADRWWLEILSR